MKPILVL